MPANHQRRAESGQSSDDGNTSGIAGVSGIGLLIDFDLMAEEHQ